MQVSVRAGGSNVNAVGAAQMAENVKALFEGVTVGEERTSVATLIPDGVVVAGVAGVGASDNRALVMQAFTQLGFREEAIHLVSDGALALEMIPEEGVVLIAGTGSICLGRSHGAKLRAGGLGRILGDEGSGYRIGLEAVRRALADEGGWGAPTALTQTLKEHFQVDKAI